MATSPTRYRLLDDDGKRRRVKVVVHRGFEGFVVRWTDSCSGCHETEDGYSVGSYEYDAKAQCELGAGCDECGHRGKVRRAEWVPFDDVAHAYGAWWDRVWARYERLRSRWEKRAA